MTFGQLRGRYIKTNSTKITMKEGIVEIDSYHTYKACAIIYRTNKSGNIKPNIKFFTFLSQSLENSTGFSSRLIVREIDVRCPPVTVALLFIDVASTPVFLPFISLRN